jgi:hypothetical protein
MWYDRLDYFAALMGSFFSLTNLASLANFALLEVVLTLPSLTEVALAVLTTPLTLSSPLEVLQGGSLQDVVGRLHYTDNSFFLPSWPTWWP